MEVTNKNFKDVLPQVQAAVDEADFLAIDTELTGLGTNEYRPHALDLPEERYHKLRKGAMDFHIIQFGLATFRYDPDSHKYLSQVFNFYIFPRPFSRQAPDVRFTCQASSLDFLCSHDFDFNKCFKEGITYLRPDHEEKLKRVLKEKHEAIKSMQQLMSPGFSSPCVDGSQPIKGPVTVPEEHKPFVDSTCAKVDSFLNSTDESVSLAPVNGFLRKLIYQTVNMKFGSQVHLQTKTENKKRYIEIRRVGNKEDVEQLEKARRQAELDELDDATGFTKVINILTLSRKVILGHNVLLDLMHTLHRFRCSLPESYEDFKALAHCVFPRLLDTKHLASCDPLKDIITNTGLGGLMKVLQSELFSKPVIEFEENIAGYGSSDEKFHDAGYDAYATGYCFIVMANYLGSKESNGTFYVKKDSSILEPYLNKVHLMWVYDVRYINIAGKDGQESRSHVFHLTFPSDWRNNDLNQLFSSFGSIYITWIDDNSAFVTLHNRNVSQLVMSQLSPGENYSIMPYSEYKDKRSWSTFVPTAAKPHQRVPASDVQLPTKRKRSLEGGSLSSRRSITTITEEDETMEDEAPKNDDEDTGVPIKRTKIEEKNGSEDKVFIEPAKW